MKYVRNSGKKKTKKPAKGKDLKTKKEIVFSEDHQNKVIKQILDDEQWLKSLARKKTFSKEWVQEIFVELLFQCMGKKDLITTNMFGQQIVARVFKEKGAIQALSILAKMDGHLFDVVKGKIEQTGTVEHQHTIELKPDANRTVEVFEILEECGALQPQIEYVSHSEVEQVHSA